jgi:NADPH-dependent ferric siderophore reductase
MKTLEDAKQRNEETGHYFFSPDTMRFFKSQVETPLLGGEYFVTSERAPHDTSRRYTLRQIDWDTGEVNTIGEFYSHRSVDCAKDALTEHLKN